MCCFLYDNMMPSVFNAISNLAVSKFLQQGIKSLISWRNEWNLKLNPQNSLINKYIYLLCTKHKICSFMIVFEKIRLLY